MSPVDFESQDEAVLIIPIHNRKAVTIKCLDHLAAQGDLDSFHSIVVDDGSTDGSADAIRAKYPQVHLLQGDGHLWWVGALKLAMEYAYDRGAQYFIWLNDDTLPDKGAITFLVHQCSLRHPCVIGVQCYETEQYKQPTYGGYRRVGLRLEKIYPSSGKEVSCDSLNGNLTCFHRDAVEQVGFPLADRFPQYHGETVYTWQLKQAGFRLILTDQVRAVCSLKRRDPCWGIPETSVLDLWKRLGSPKSPLYIPSFWHFRIALWGPLGALLFIRPYLRLCLISLMMLILPKVLLQKLKTRPRVDTSKNFRR